MSKKVTVFIIAIIGSFSAGAIGSLATSPNIPTWYTTLEKPLLNPPNWVFGPVWSILYLLMGIALALVIIKTTEQLKKEAYIWYACQLILNALWSLAFFGLRSPWLGVVVIFALIVAIAMTIRKFYQIEKLSAWLLLPYLAWVCFATYLTIGVALLNS